MIKQRIQIHLKKALKKGRKFEVSVLRMLMAAIKNKEIKNLKKEEGLADEEIIEVISSEIKKRKEALELYKKGERDELAEKEEKEIEILERFLPEQLSEKDLRASIKEVIKKQGATGPQDLGKVMGVLMPEIKGKAEGSKVREIVEEELAPV